MKTIVVAGHPDLEHSRVNAEFLSQLSRTPATIHRLSESHRNYDFDIPREQTLLAEHERIVLLFPLFWYSMPALMKKWLDDVFLPGFAYARGGDKLAGKEILAVTTVGAPSAGYRAGGFNNHTIDELLRPLQQTVRYVKATFLPTIAVYESVFIDEASIKAAVAEAVPHIIGRQESPDQLYEKMLLKAELAQIALISA